MEYYKILFNGTFMQIYRLEEVVDLIKNYDSQITYILHMWDDVVLGSISIENIKDKIKGASNGKDNQA